MLASFAVEVYENVQGIYCIAFVNSSVVVTWDRNVLIYGLLLSVFVNNNLCAELIPLCNVETFFRECLEAEFCAFLYLLGILYLLSCFYHRAGYIAELWLLALEKNHISFFLCFQRSCYVQCFRNVVDRPYFAVDRR